MTPFRAAREALGWTIAEAAQALELSWRYVKRLDEGERDAQTVCPHTLTLMQTWAADWFPAEHRPQPRRKDAA